MKISDIKHFIHEKKRRLVDGMILGGRRRRFPDKIVIETTNACTLRCSCCPNGNSVARRRSGIMSREVFDKVLANIDIPVRLCFLHMCGEPFLNPHLDYFCSRLLERRIIPTVFSNGYGIDLDLLDRILKLKGVRISFSMELHSKEDYERIRVPGVYEKAVEALDEINRRFLHAKRVYGLNVILPEYSDSKTTEKIARELFGRYSNLADITFSSEWPWPGIPATGNLSGHLSDRRSYCSQAKGLPAILWDGRASFCNLDYAGRLIVGDITATPLSGIVNNKASRMLRRRLAMGATDAGSLCHGCVLPAYNSFTLNVTRGKLRGKDTGSNPDLFRMADEYFLRK